LSLFCFQQGQYEAGPAHCSGAFVGASNSKMVVSEKKKRHWPGLANLRQICGGGFYFIKGWRARPPLLPLRRKEEKNAHRRYSLCGGTLSGGPGARLTGLVAVNLLPGLYLNTAHGTVEPFQPSQPAAHSKLIHEYVENFSQALPEFLPAQTELHSAETKTYDRSELLRPIPDGTWLDSCAPTNLSVSAAAPGNGEKPIGGDWKNGAGRPCQACQAGGAFSVGRGVVCFYQGAHCQSNPSGKLSPAGR